MPLPKPHRKLVKHFDERGEIHELLREWTTELSAEPKSGWKPIAGFSLLGKPAVAPGVTIVSNSDLELAVPFVGSAQSQIRIRLMADQVEEYCSHHSRNWTAEAVGVTFDDRTVIYLQNSQLKRYQACSISKIDKLRNAKRPPAASKVEVVARARTTLRP